MFKRNLVLAYVLLVGLPLLVVVGVLHSGTGLTAPAALPAQPTQSGSQSTAPLDLVKLVIQIALILIVSRVVGMLFKKIRQPQVIGEMVAGILLGPSLLGWASPALSQAIFPASSLGYLNALSQVGLVLFMFAVGIHLDPSELKKHGHAAVLLMSNASILMPFCLGSVLALFLYPRLSNAGVTFASFALFMGAAMSITAFPVLARILTEHNLMRSRIGTLSIACAALNDITGWCLLAYIMMLIRAGKAPLPLWVTIGGALVYVLVMLFGVRPLLPRFEAHFQKAGHLTEGSISLMIALMLVSALATEALGVHLVFGAFLMGAIMPKSQEFTQTLLHKMESVTVIVLLPLFFASSGLRTNIGMLTSHLWLYTLLIVLVAIAGKFGGSMIAARMAELPWRESASLGILMNTRGLMELIALNIGLDMGVISPTVFTIMVVMALVTTFMTSPLLEWVYPRRLMLIDGEDVAKNVA